MMLKSTYRAVPATAATDSLPPGWTEHKAPTGHTYYYNAQTKQSTYNRPAAEPETDDLQIDYNATAPDQVVQASMKALDEFRQNNVDVDRGQGHFTGGKSYQDRSRRNKNQDRPKSKAPITNCKPWVLVKTKYGRRFVHNTETKESFWKFPQDVMMAVIEMDRLEWEAKRKVEEKKDQPDDVQGEGDKPVAAVSTGAVQEEGYDSDEYEEVEVTDDEGEDGTALKRLRMDDDDTQADTAHKHMEFDEDDIAWQLAQMDEDDYPEEGFDDDDNDENAGEDEDGLPLTAEDSAALFRSLLDDHRTDPYSTFDALIEYDHGAIVDDPRWVSLPNMSSRRTAFTNWSRDRVAELKAREASEASATATHKRNAKKDPRVAYLDFLREHATPKLYWPEFKRKHRKEPAMKDLQFPDRDREKLYREYVAKLKGTAGGGSGEADRKREFREALKSVPPGEESWSRQTQLDDLPDVLLRDLRFYLVRDVKTRDELVRAHLDSLK